MKGLAMQGAFMQIQKVHGEKNAKKCFDWFVSKAVQVKKKQNDGKDIGEMSTFMEFYLCSNMDEDVAMDEVVARFESSRGQGSHIEVSRSPSDDEIIVKSSIQDILGSQAVPLSQPFVVPLSDITTSQGETAGPAEVAASSCLSPSSQAQINVKNKQATPVAEVPHQASGFKTPTASTIVVSVAAGKASGKKRRAMKPTKASTKKEKPAMTNKVQPRFTAVGKRASSRLRKDVSYLVDDSNSRKRSTRAPQVDKATFPMQLPTPDDLHPGISADGHVSGIKQDNLTADEDLLHTDVSPRSSAAEPNDKEFLTMGTPVVLVVRAYLEFVSALGTQITDAVDKEDLLRVFKQGRELINGVTDKAQELTDHPDFYLLDVTLSSEKTPIRLIYQKRSVLQGEEFLVVADRFEQSMVEPWLVVGGPVRKRFGREDGGFEWHEGIVYHIAPDMLENPYESVRVVWVDKEESTCQWFYSYAQSCNHTSPWDLHLSAFVLPENVCDIKSPKLPESLMTLPLSPAAIVDYFKAFDFAWPFLVDLSKIDEYVTAFPEPSDQLDLLKIWTSAQHGGYDGDLTKLFSDLVTMCVHGKQFNADNELFQTWRCIDMVEMSIYDLQHRLLETFGDKKLPELRPTVDKWIKERILSRKAVDESL